MSRISCSCRPSHDSPCDNTGKELCHEGVEHCLLTSVKNQSENLHIPHIQRCWPWKHENFRCPNTTGVCYVISQNHDYLTCCCKGSLCNNSTDLETANSPNATRFPLPTDPHLPPFDGRTHSPSTPVNSLPPLHLALAILIPVVLLGFAVALFACLYVRFWAHRKCKQQHIDRQRQYQRINEVMNCSTLTPVGPQLAIGEIEQVASKCIKVEVKAHGRFGNVWLANLSPGNGLTSIEVAVKIFHGPEERSWEAETEVYRLPGLPHTNVLRFIGADKVVGNLTTELWLVTEYHARGSVFDYLQSGGLTWSRLVHVAAGMARGLTHLHAEIPSKPSIAHRDLKSKNVLLKDDFTACIADLGLAIRFEAGQCVGDAHQQVGTKRYMAPEVLEGAIQFSRDAFLRIDVYAMGLVIWELMSRLIIPSGSSNAGRLQAYHAPFEEELGPQPSMEHFQHWVAQGKHRPKFRPEWSDHQGMCALWETIEECWDQDAEARLSAGCVAERLQSLPMVDPGSATLAPDTEEQSTVAEEADPNNLLLPMPTISVIYPGQNQAQSVDHVDEHLV